MFAVGLCFHLRITRYFEVARGYVRYYLSGGTEKISERKLKQMMGNGFDNLENAEFVRRTKMNTVYEMAPALAKPKNLSVAKLQELLRPLFHTANWMRKRSK